jgi:hypothetical protein
VTAAFEGGPVSACGGLLRLRAAWCG